MASHQFKVVGIWTVFRPYDKNELRGWEPCSNVPNVVGSNPSTIYWMDIFHIRTIKISPKVKKVVVKIVLFV